MNNLGIMFKLGQGVPQDYTRARQLYERSAKEGNLRAITNLAGLYEFGQGVAENLIKGINLYDYAVQQGHREATEDLQRICGKGLQRFQQCDLRTDEDLRRALVEFRQSDSEIISEFAKSFDLDRPRNLARGVQEPTFSISVASTSVDGGPQMTTENNGGCPLHDECHPLEEEVHACTHSQSSFTLSRTFRRFKSCLYSGILLH